MSFYFVPDSFVLTDELKDFAREIGFSEKDLEWQEKKWRNHQYKTPRKDPARCWRTWAMNCVEWGNVTPSVTPRLRGIEELSEEQKKADAAKAWRDLNRLKGLK